MPAIGTLGVDHDNLRAVAAVAAKVDWLAVLCLRNLDAVFDAIPDAERWEHGSVALSFVANEVLRRHV